jgi:hypothetical protein
MVWLRSRNSKLRFVEEIVREWYTDQVAATPTAQLSKEEDLPLRLSSIECWPNNTKGIHIWDVIAELVTLCCGSSSVPVNPFELIWNSGILCGLLKEEKATIPHRKQSDVQPFASQGIEQLLVTAGLIAQLQIMRLSRPLQVEMSRLCLAHFDLLNSLIINQRQMEQSSVGCKSTA